MPFALTRGWIEGHYRAREQVVAFANLRVAIRAGVAHRPKQYVHVRIVRACQPARSASAFPTVAQPRVVPEFAGAGNCIESPQTLSRRWIISVHIPGDTELASSDTDNDFAVNRQGSRCEAITLHHVVYLH